MSEDLMENYKRAFGRSVGFGERPALVRVDFAKAYFDRDCELYAGVEAALGSAVRIRAAARAAGVPVILTEVVYQEGGINGGRFYEKSKPLHNFIKGRKTTSRMNPPRSAAIAGSQFKAIAWHFQHCHTKSSGKLVSRSP